MDSLKQLLDLSEMKHALEILKEEVERLLTSDFNVSEFEKQLPINTKLAEDVDDSESHSEFISKHQNKLKNVEQEDNTLFEKNNEYVKRSFHPPNERMHEEKLAEIELDRRMKAAAEHIDSESYDLESYTKPPTTNVGNEDALVDIDALLKEFTEKN